MIIKGPRIPTHSRRVARSKMKERLTLIKQFSFTNTRFKTHYSGISCSMTFELIWQKFTECFLAVENLLEKQRQILKYCRGDIIKVILSFKT